MLGRERQSVVHRMSSMVGSGSLLMNTPWFFNCSFKSLKFARPTLGLLGGDFGDEEGVFLHVDDTDMIADDSGDTRAEDRAEYSFWASFNILMYSWSRPNGMGVVRLGEEGTGGEAYAFGNSLVRSTQELCPPGGVSVILLVPVLHPAPSFVFLPSQRSVPCLVCDW